MKKVGEPSSAEPERRAGAPWLGSRQTMQSLGARPGAMCPTYQLAKSSLLESNDDWRALGDHQRRWLRNRVGERGVPRPVPHVLSPRSTTVTVEQRFPDRAMRRNAAP